MYALRSLFVTALLLALVSIWMNTNRTIYASAIRYLADLGGGFFLAVIGTQLTLVLLAAPAATAGAICLDRARGTLTHMLMTDLSVAEIVLGKLAGRLVPVLTMLACTLPVLEILTLLGRRRSDCASQRLCRQFRGRRAGLFAGDGIVALGGQDP